MDMMITILACFSILTVALIATGISVLKILKQSYADSKTITSYKAVQESYERAARNQIKELESLVANLKQVQATALAPIPAPVEVPKAKKKNTITLENGEELELQALGFD